LYVSNSIKEYIKTYLWFQCFEPLRKLNPYFKEKIQIIQGDCYKECLGLSPVDQEKIKNDVTTIFHIAAIVRFDQDLRTATYVNVRSTRDLLILAKCIKNLRVSIN